MLDCIVIGAGPGGLVCTKELLEQGLDEVVCLEQTNNLGGVFANAYDGLVLTSSATISMFSDYWIGDGNQHRFWTKNEAVEYWRGYAKHFGVIDRIRFNSKVVAVIPQEDGDFEVQLASGETLVSKRIALAIGNNSIPKYPAWKDLLTDVECLHSKDYRNADRFVGKNVLTLGGGESGSDVALETSRVANNCWVSLRNAPGWLSPRTRNGISATDISTHRGIWGLPRDYGPAFTDAINRYELRQKNPVNDAVFQLNQKIKNKKGIWGTYATRSFSLAKAVAHHGCKVVGEIVKVEDGGKTLHTKDGEILKNIDAIVFSTGYKNHVSFLPEELKETDPRSLYKHMFHPKYRDKIAWIGWARPNLGSQFPIMEMQARFFALICKGEKTLPSPTEMERLTSFDRAIYLEQFEHTAHRIRSLVDYYRFMDDMVRLIGCEPPLRKYFFLNFPIWLTMVYGSYQGTQFRLKGPGNKESLAQEILKKLPVSNFNLIVKAGLKGRIIYTLKALVPKFGLVGSWSQKMSHSKRWLIDSH
ncbi:MAG: NAD(P)-binding domain-containing protein [Cyanobacteria bacterium P01_A01_bin.45]